MTVDSSEYSLFKSHIVETLHYLIPVSSELFFVYYTALDHDGIGMVVLTLLCCILLSFEVGFLLLFNLGVVAKLMLGLRFILFIHFESLFESLGACFKKKLKQKIINSQINLRFNS